MAQVKTTTALASVNATITDFIQANIQEAQTISPAYAALWQEIDRLFQAGGKRLRPKMVLLAYEAFGGCDIGQVIPIAAACELLHQSVLVHDDIIDRDTRRYGVLNISGGYQQQYSALISDASQRRHYADSAAIMAGDVLLAGAYQLLAQASVPSAIMQHFNRSIFEVIGGELIDTEAAFRGPAADKPLTVARYKTAGYSFVAPLLMGAAAAGATKLQLSSLRQFAEQLGIAFQLQDDILGIFGDEAVTGKSTTGDIKEGKRTYMAECFEAMAGPAEHEQFAKLYGKTDLNSQEATLVRQLLMDSGARSQAELKISQLESGAITALAALKLPAGQHDTFIDLINKSLKRTA